MTFKTYCKVMFHSIVTIIIMLSFPVATLLLTQQLPTWAVVPLTLLSCFPTIFLGIKYIFWAGNKLDID